MPPKPKPPTPVPTASSDGSTQSPIPRDDDPSGGESNVQVIMRPRPLNELELSKAGDKVCISLGDNYVELLNNTSSTDPPRFSFDRILSPSAPQSELFDMTGPKAVKDVLAGYNSTIFAYGQTSSGKTFTMLGPTMDLNGGDQAGFIPRTIVCLFAALDEAAKKNPNMEITVKVSYVEVYMEVIRDLLEPSSINLELREDKERGVFIDKVRSIYVTSPEETLDVLSMGADNRELSATGMNAASSRSHSVLMLTVRQKNAEDETTKEAKLVMVDLAGSESVSKTGAVGLQLDQAKMINKSLLSLNLVIQGLSQRKSHIPYRDSKLTRMLQESLGGNARTVLVICVSMSTYNAAETFSTIRFGACAKTIKNKPKVNVTRSLREVIDALDAANKTIARQARVISSMQATIDAYRQVLRQNGLPDNVPPPDASAVAAAISAGAAAAPQLLSPTAPPSSEATLGSPIASGSPVPKTSPPSTPTSRAPTRTRPASGNRTSIVGVNTRSRPSSASKHDSAVPVTFATLSLAPMTVSVPLDSPDDDELAISSSLGPSKPRPTLADPPAGRDVAPAPSVVPAAKAAELNMRVLELEDEVSDMRRRIDDKEALLKSREDELACLSTSLLEKEKLLRGGGMSGAMGGSGAGDEAHMLASASMLNREIENAKTLVCKHCASKPFEQANSVADLFTLHQQACFPAQENKYQVRQLGDRVASLNSEVEALKSYVEAISMEIMGDNAEEYDEVKRGDRTVAELAKAKRLLGEKEMELQKLQKIMRSTDPRLEEATARKIALLQEDLAIKEAQLREAQESLYAKDVVLYDVEEQLKHAGEGGLARALNHQLRQMVLVHRQLLRKFAVIDVECSGQLQQLQAKEAQISQLNKEILRLNETLREQSEWSALQMSQLHMENMRRQAAAAAAATAPTVGGVIRGQRGVHTLGNAVRSVGGSRAP